MPFLLVKNDITKMEVDAIVNAANSSLLGGGGVDGAIHAAAGPELLEECKTLGGCKTGEAKLTKGYHLPAKFVIHTVGPIYQDGKHDEETYLRSAYRSSLAIAEEQGFSSVAFPLISGGVYGYPKAEAVKIAEEELSSFSDAHDDVTLYLVLFRKDDLALSCDLHEAIEQYLQTPDELDPAEELRAKKYALYCAVNAAVNPSSKKASSEKKAKKKHASNAASSEEEIAVCESISLESPEPNFLHNQKTVSFPGLSGNLTINLDESFQKTLFRLIDEKGLTDPQCYKKANIDKREFSRIRSNEFYKPSKTTACAFALALELTLEETQDFLLKAGLILSKSLVFDCIIMYCLEQKIYNYVIVNQLLFSYDQPLIGTKCAES